MIEHPGIVLLVVAGIATALLLLRRHRASAPDGVRVLARTALHKGAVVAVVAVGERRLLLGAGERGVQLIADLDTSVGAVRSDTDATSYLGAVSTAGAELYDLDILAAATPGTAARRTAASSTDNRTTVDLDDRRDVVASRPTDGGNAADAALIGLASRTRSTTNGPGIGLVDRLRDMTVRTPTSGRPSRVSLRR